MAKRRDDAKRARDIVSAMRRRRRNEGAHGQYGESLLQIAAPEARALQHLMRGLQRQMMLALAVPKELLRDD